MTQQQPPAPPDKPDQPAEQPTELAEQPTELASELPNEPLPAPPPPPAPTAPPKKKRRIWPYVTIGVVLLLILVGVGGVVLLGSLLREEVPAVGECLNDAPLAVDMDVVDCGSAEAAWSVIGNDGAWTRGEFDAAAQGDVCQEFPTTEQALWVTSSSSEDSGTEGEVICLAPVG